MSGQRNTVRGSIRFSTGWAQRDPGSCRPERRGRWMGPCHAANYTRRLEPGGRPGTGDLRSQEGLAHRVIQLSGTDARDGTSSIAFRSFLPCFRLYKITTASLPVWTVLPRVTIPNVLAVSPTEILFFLKKLFLLLSRRRSCKRFSNVLAINTGVHAHPCLVKTTTKKKGEREGWCPLAE